MPRVRGYDVVRVAGSGGLGRVFLGVQKALSRQVAIKVVDLDADESDPRVARFLRDARLMATLDHPNIVAIIEAGRTEDGHWFYAMPYLPNGDLRALVGRATPNDVRKIGVQLLSALEHAHAAGLTHRDLKPKTILLDRAGRPMLSDFGLGLALRDASVASGDTVSGSRYRSPEHQAGKAPGTMGEAYSLAAMLFELLTGRLPYADAGDYADGGPRVPSSVAKWQPWFARALAIDPAARYASLAEMRQALQDLPSDGPIPPVWVAPPVAATPVVSSVANDAAAPVPSAPIVASVVSAPASSPVAVEPSAVAAPSVRADFDDTSPSVDDVIAAANAVMASRLPAAPANITVDGAAVDHATVAMPVIDAGASSPRDERPTPSIPFDMAPVGGSHRPGTMRQRPIWWIPAVAVLALVAIGAPFLVRRWSDGRGASAAHESVATSGVLESSTVPMPEAATPAPPAAKPASPAANAPTRAPATGATTAAPTAGAAPKPLADVVRAPAGAPPRDARSRNDDDAGTGVGYRHDDEIDHARDVASRERGLVTWRYHNAEFDPPIPPLILSGSRRDQVDAIRDHLRAGRGWIESERDRFEAKLDYLREGEREDERLAFEDEREAYERWRAELEDLRGAVERGRGPLD